MNNRNKFSASLYLLLAGYCLATCAAAATADQGTGLFDAKYDDHIATDDAANSESLLLRVRHTDLRSLMQGWIKKLISQPIRGHYKSPIYTDHRFGQLGVHGVAYEFQIASIDVAPAKGSLKFYFELKNLNIKLDRITFDKKERRWCSDLPITSGKGIIPLSADATLVVQDYAIDLDVSNQHIGLTRDNFFIGKPSRCHALPGFNWLLRRLTPWFAKIVRDRIKENISISVVDGARRTVQSLNDFLQINITLPFAADPVPAFYATVRVWPANFVVESDVIRFGMGADIYFDPDFWRIRPDASLHARKLAPLARPALDDKLADGSPTYAGIKRSLLAAILNEANTKGLFRFRTDAQAWPQIAEFLSIPALAQILPDAQRRFSAQTAVSLVAHGAKSTDVRIDPLGPGGLPILLLKLKDFQLSVQAAGQAYYELLLDLDVALEAGYNRERHELVFGLSGINAHISQHQFADELSPPILDTRFLRTGFEQLMTRINSKIAENSTRIMGIHLPDLVLGDRRLEFLGSQLREDSVTLDGHVVETQLSSH